MKFHLTLLALVFANTSILFAQETQIQDPQQSKELNTQAYIQLLRMDLRANTEALIREGMQLNDQQSAVFWPIYREYSAEQTKLGDARLAIIQDYTHHFLTMNDQKADQLAQRVMELDDKRMALRKKYYGIVSKNLGAVLAVRFFQLEHQIQLILDLQMASHLPIIEQAPSK
jgi:serine/threonine protein phosphatase PrpC